MLVICFFFSNFNRMSKLRWPAVQITNCHLSSLGHIVFWRKLELWHTSWNFLQLLQSSVHPIFHVSQLKRSPEGNQVSSTLSSDLVMFQVPEKILQRHRTSGDHQVEQVYVKWSHMPVSLAT
jgi:hypothetical protein